MCRAIANGSFLCTGQYPMADFWVQSISNGSFLCAGQYPMVDFWVQSISNGSFLCTRQYPMVDFCGQSISNGKFLCAGQYPFSGQDYARHADSATESPQRTQQLQVGQWVSIRCCVWRHSAWRQCVDRWSTLSYLQELSLNLGFSWPKCTGLIIRSNWGRMLDS